jgi:uncharacterized protein with HEPN domain
LRDDRERLTDILEAIDRAQRYAVRGRAAFEVEHDLPGLRKAVVDLLGERS